MQQSFGAKFFHTIGNSTDVLAFNSWQRVWPRAVPRVRITILSGRNRGRESAGLSKRKARPKWERSAKRMRRRKDERRLEDKTRRKRDVFCRALECAQREFEDPSTCEEGNWERKCLSCRGWIETRRRLSDTWSEYHPESVLLLKFRFSAMSRKICRRVSSGAFPRNFHREARTKYQKVCVCVCVCAIPRCRSFRVEWNRTAGLTKSRRDYDDSWLWQIPLRRYRSLNAIAISQSLRSRPCCGWNITPVDIVSARNGNQLYAPGKLRRDIVFGNISGRFFGYSVPREIEKYRYRKMLCCVNIVVMNAIIYL